MISLGLDSLGNLLACGWDGEYNAVHKLDTLGNLIWAWRDTITDHNGSTVSGLVPDGRGGVYVQERFIASIPDPPYYTNITSVVHLAEGQAVAENPGVGHRIRVTMAPSGFFISGYDGEAMIYDPAGRLVLSRKMKGKQDIDKPTESRGVFCDSREREGKGRGAVATRTLAIETGRGRAL